MEGRYYNMKMKNCEDQIGFVILHYQLLEQTIDCVSSIMKYAPGSIVVIVDNGSPNGSGRMLQEKYCNNESVYCLLLEENLGFARGNNVGYQWLKEKGEYDFICCINNDTLLIQDDFKEKVAYEYRATEFAVMAPLALQKDNSIQSFASSLKTIEEYQKEYELWKESETLDYYLSSMDKKTYFLLRFPYVMGLIRKIKQKISCPYKRRMKDVVLHGCFLVFSRDYIQRFDTAFNEKTFMYREEELLYLRVKEHGLKTLYCPDIVIKHIENASTNDTYTDKEEKYRFRRKNQLESLKILLSELET